MFVYGQFSFVDQEFRADCNVVVVLVALFE